MSLLLFTAALGISCPGWRSSGAINPSEIRLPKNIVRGLLFLLELASTYDKYGLIYKPLDIFKTQCYGSIPGYSLDYGDALSCSVSAFSIGCFSIAILLIPILLLSFILQRVRIRPREKRRRNRRLRKTLTN
ncbi:hypothetical protein TRVA0_014S01354 [Trichomonascus vanleenenianus]|uniref:uncharacterized protein n=1 Tax=Trichomonascus vanleenenianus TaxID=2268995 RepID=UPI003ECB2D6C